MRSLLRLATAVLLSSIAFPTPVRADPITVGGGWMNFFFSGSGWDRIFQLTALESTRITVTDAYLSGDQFLVSVESVGRAASTSFLTSAPTAFRAFTEDFDFAASDPRWSSGTVDVPAGEYIVSGTAIKSPFGGGGGGIRADVSPTPEPASLLLMGSGALCALVARRRKARSKDAARAGGR